MVVGVTDVMRVVTAGYIDKTCDSVAMYLLLSFVRETHLVCFQWQFMLVLILTVFCICY